MKFVLASRNPDKLQEMREILSDLGIEVVSEEELGVDLEVEETGDTFQANAALKAQAVMQATDLPAIADDSGLCIHAMNNAPGVYSARYGGEISYPERFAMIQRALQGQVDRRAHFHSAIVCSFPNGDLLHAAGTCEGTIAYAPQGEGGFGYDPIFFVPQYKKTFAQLSPAEKNTISHRGNALRAFKKELESYLHGTDK